MTVLIFALMAWELAALSDTPAQPVARMGIAALAGLGLALALLAMVPLLNLLVPVLGIAGATHLLTRGLPGLPRTA